MTNIHRHAAERERGHATNALANAVKGAKASRAEERRSKRNKVCDDALKRGLDEAQKRVYEMLRSKQEQPEHDQID